MAGASDPLEDVLSNEVDQKAVSDLVGSLESQLGDRKTPVASYSDGKGDPAAAAAGHFSGKPRDQVGSAEQPPQQGHPKAGLTREPGVNEPLSGQALPSSTSPGVAGTVRTTGTSLQTTGAPTLTASPGPGPVTFSTQPVASFQRAAVLGPSAAVNSAEAIRTSSPGLQGLNGSAGAGVPPPGGVSSVISAGGSAIVGSMASQPGSPAVALQGNPSPVGSAAQNGLELKGAPSTPASQVLNHSNPLMHTKLLVAGQTPTGTSVILNSTPPPAASQSPIIQTQTGTSTVGAKPIINGVAQPAMAMVRPPGAPVGGPTSIQQQRPGLVAGTTRAAAPQPGITVRPQQQTTIHLPPGFTIPPGQQTHLWWVGGVT